MTSQPKQKQSLKNQLKECINPMLPPMIMTVALAIGTIPVAKMVFESGQISVWTYMFVLMVNVGAMVITFNGWYQMVEFTRIEKRLKEILEYVANKE